MGCAPLRIKEHAMDHVLDVAFSSATDGVLLGLVESRAVTVSTVDGGATWQTVE